MNTKLLLVSLALAPVLVAQDAPQPSPKMKPFERLLGSWVGSGTVNTPEQGSMEWSGQLHAEKVLGGHFIKDRTQIDVMPGAAVQFESYFGIDPATDRPMIVGVGNNGDPMGSAELVWVDDDTLILTDAGINGELPYIERRTWSFDKDSYGYKLEVAMGDAEFSTMIDGTFKRTDKKLRFAKDAAFAFGAPVPAQMSELARLAGAYATKGWYEMDLPDGSSMKMDLRGTETIRSRFGGHLVQFETTGYSDQDPDNPYHAILLSMWNAQRKHYECVSMSNMGEFARMELHRGEGNTFTGHAMHPWQGKTMLGRSVLTFGKNGPEVMEGHAMWGASEPKHNFHMTYKPVD